MRGFLLISWAFCGCNLFLEDWEKSQDCGEPAPLEHGSIDVGDGTGLDATALYECNDGYELIGEEARTCDADGHWSGVAATCQLVDCGILYPPTNGKVDLSDGTEYQDTALYSCDDEYLLEGLNERTCLGDGEWGDDPPVCLKLTAVNAAIMTEFGYDWAHTCAEAQYDIMSAFGDWIVRLTQLPIDELNVGSCGPSPPIVTLIGADRIELTFDPNPMACAPISCWDIEIMIDTADIPSGEYTFIIGDYTQIVTK